MPHRNTAERALKLENTTQIHYRVALKLGGGGAESLQGGRENWEMPCVESLKTADWLGNGKCNSETISYWHRISAEWPLDFRDDNQRHSTL